MRSFTIHELECLSGVKAHTLRIWERRYTAFQPQRTSGNVRKYCIDELGKVLQLSLLSRCGFRISRICAMGPEEVDAAVQGLRGEDQQMERSINELLMAMYRMDAAAFEGTLEKSFRRWSSEEAMRHILLPFLEKVGLLRQGNRLNEEHLVVTAVRQKMLWCIEELPSPPRNGKSILLFLAPGRQLDLLLLYLNYHLKKNGWQVVYMGGDISLQNLEGMLLHRQPQYLITYLGRRASIDLEALSARMSELAPSASLLLVGGETAGAAGLTNIVPATIDAILRLNPVALDEPVARLV